jgi:hypothetical protein
MTSFDHQENGPVRVNHLHAMVVHAERVIHEKEQGANTGEFMLLTKTEGRYLVTMAMSRQSFEEGLTELIERYSLEKEVAEALRVHRSHRTIIEKIHEFAFNANVWRFIIKLFRK